MDIEAVRHYCISRKAATEDLPFDEFTLAFRVMGKIFALLPLENGDRINLKCDPDKAIELREQYEEIQPGYHMNKKHWNTVFFDGSLPSVEFLALIDHSYELIVASLKKSEREALAQL